MKRLVLRWIPLLALVGAVACTRGEKAASDDLAAALDLHAADLAAIDLAAIDLATVDLVAAAASDDLTMATTDDLLVPTNADLTTQLDLPGCVGLDFSAEPGINFGLSTGGINTMEVTVTRGSVTGPLTVTASDPDSYVSAPAEVIADGDSTATLTFAAVATVPGLGGFVTITVSTGACIVNRTINYNIGGSGDFTLTLEPSTKSISRDTVDVVLIKLDRIAAFGGQITITATGLPSGVTVPALSLTGIETEANLTFTVSPTATLGTVDVTITGNATTNAGPVTHSATLTLTISDVPSFTLSSESPTISVRQGGMSELDLTVVRDSGYTAALTTGLLQAQPGVTATEGAFAVSGLTSTLEISAAPDALLLVPTATTVRTTDGTVARPLPLEVLVTPELDAQRVGTFGHDGVVVKVESRDGGDYPQAVKGVSGSKMLVFSTYSRRRYNADGSPDATFTTTNYGLNARAVAIDAGTGESYAIEMFGSDQAKVVKMDPEGAIDTAFGTAGTALLSVPGANREIAAIAAGHGSVYVGFYATFSTNDFVVTRLDATDGSVDTGFATAGTFIYDSGGHEYMSNLVPLADGVLIVGAQPGAVYPSTPVLLVRLDADGELLASFDGDGVRSLESVSGVGANHAVLDGDQVLLAGIGFADEELFGEFKRVSVTTGQLDTSFGGGDGIVTIPGLRQMFTVQLDGAGRIVVGGRDQSYAGVDSGMFIARLTDQAAFDTTFSTDGIARIAGGTPSGYMQACTAIHIDGDGNYLAFGQFQPNHFIAKYAF